MSRYDSVEKYVSRAEVGTLVNALREKALVLDNLPKVAYSPDPDDNPILSAGVTGQVQYIVSGDKNYMLALKTVKGIPIVTARSFVALFDKAGQQ